MKPNFLNPMLKYLALNASRLSLSLPSVPFSRLGGSDSQVGREEAGAGP
jgi:hypothetical protein